MGFESGSVSCRMLVLPRPLPRNAIEQFAKHAAPPIDTLSDGEINGWVSGRHLLDRKITEENAMYAGFLRLTLMKAEKKIPESLLRAECKIEELAQIAASGVEKLSASARSEIRRSVSARLLPQMPPQLKGIHFVHDAVNDVIYTTALSEKQLDAFQIQFAQAVGFGAIPVIPETAAAQRRKVRIKEWSPASFSPEAEDDEMNHEPGQDFLTWLWFVAEARGGMMKIEDVGDVALMIEGPLTFAMEGSGAHETVLRRGEPLVSTEAKAALMGGKKLKRAKLTLARGDQSWTCTFDAEQFIIRGLKMPEGEKLDAVSKFQERMSLLNTFRAALLGLHDRFVDERQNASAWKKTLAEMKDWVSSRKTRR